MADEQGWKAPEPARSDGGGNKDADPQAISTPAVFSAPVPVISFPPMLRQVPASVDPGQTKDDASWFSHLRQRPRGELLCRRKYPVISCLASAHMTGEPQRFSTRQTHMAAYRPSIAERRKAYELQHAKYPPPPKHEGVLTRSCWFVIGRPGLSMTEALAQLPFLQTNPQPQGHPLRGIVAMAKDMTPAAGPYVQSPAVCKEAVPLPYEVPENGTQEKPPTQLTKVPPKPSQVKAAVRAEPADPLEELQKLQARLSSTITQVRALARPEPATESPSAPMVTPEVVQEALATSEAKKSRVSTKQKDWHKRRALGSLGANHGVAWH